MSDKADLLADMECRNMHGDANENLVISSGEVVSNLEVSSQPHACGDGMSTVTEQVKKYRNRLKIRASEKFAAFGSLPESLFRVLKIALSSAF